MPPTLATIVTQSFAVLGLLTACRMSACELCAIYGADSARANSNRGLVWTMSEQYVSQQTLQFEGNPVSYPFFKDAFLNSSYSHIVPGYNFSSRVGVSLNAPIIYRDFRRTQQASP